MSPRRKVTADERTDFSRLDWRRKEIGRIAVASGALTRKEWDARQRILTKLYDAGQYETLRALKRGAIGMRELVAADRTGRLLHADLLGDIKLRGPLWTALEQAVEKLGRTASTRATYRSVVRTFATRAGLPKDARVADLLTLDWSTVRPKYGAPANWNALGRVLSSCLTRILGDQHHAARRQLLKVFGGLEKEPKGKVVTLTAQQAAKILRAVPEPVRPAVAVLMATGVRIGEYLSAARGSYDPETGQWTVRGKTGTREVTVPRVARPYMAVALPFPWKRGVLYRAIKAAGKAIGKPALTPHDLRHAATIWTLEGGASLEDARDMLGHEDIQTTARYARTLRQERTSRTLDRKLRGVLTELDRSTTSTESSTPRRARRAPGTGAAPAPGGEG